MINTKSLKLAFASAFLVAMSMAGGTAQAGSCRTIGGLAEMPTRALAEFMADAALKNAIAGHGMKPAGPITMKCKDDTLTTTCTARRQACH
jgi:hypothetical protein